VREVDRDRKGLYRERRMERGKATKEGLRSVGIGLAVYLRIYR
jgi:hypothetical protein